MDNIVFSAYNSNALSAYIETIQQIRLAAENILEWADDHGHVLPDWVNWGHVGHANSVLSALIDVAEMC